MEYFNFTKKDVEHGKITVEVELFQSLDQIIVEDVVVTSSLGTELNPDLVTNSEIIRAYQLQSGETQVDVEELRELELLMMGEEYYDR
ncbi:hypothetical protein NVP1121O_095 [Vibrio phage 1.121.O._10N.286.46.C4]|nr:hypothetical protein NVP1121O_095 [Vibrio phage 1.121.O._10N.286.46.C4]